MRLDHFVMTILLVMLLLSAALGIGGTLGKRACTPLSPDGQSTSHDGERT